MENVRRMLRESLEESPVVDKDGYQYFVNPLTDGIPHVDPALISEVVRGFGIVADLDCDVILAPEAMGIPLATGLSLATGIPFSIIRKRRYGLPGELEIRQVTGDSESRMYVNGLGPGDRVVIVDDVISTGGTLAGIAEVLRGAGIVLTEVLVILDKSQDLTVAESRIGAPVRSLAKVVMVDGRPVVPE